MARSGALLSPAVLLLATVLLTGWTSPAAAEPPDAVMLVHGNSCSLRQQHAPLPPVDALDEARARHDACTPDEGLPSKACHALVGNGGARALTRSRAAGAPCT